MDGVQVVELAKKTKRRRGNALEKWEVGIVKAMLAKQDRTDQDILAYFTRPTRSVNHRLIGQIRKGPVHSEAGRRDGRRVSRKLAGRRPPNRPEPSRGSAQLIKAREAMIAAVHNFNGAGLHFRAELSNVTAIIAWTYLHHAYFKLARYRLPAYRGMSTVSNRSPQLTVARTGPGS